VLNPTGKTTKNRQNNAKFVSRDSGNARNGSTGQRAPWSEGKRVRVKPDTLKNSK
jgi:hypothetical protein